MTIPAHPPGANVRIRGAERQRIDELASTVQAACAGVNMLLNRSFDTLADVESAEVGLNAARLLIATTPDLDERLDAALRPASRDEVRKALALLVDAFPAQRAGNPEAYVRQLVEDVYDDRPSLAALECAAREIRRTERFVPTISVVLETLGTYQRMFSQAEAAGRVLRVGVSRLEKTIEVARERLGEMEDAAAAARERRQAATEAAQAADSQEADTCGG